MANNQIIQQGTLNKIRGSVIVSNYPTLNITAPYMGRNFLTIAFDGDFTKLIGTGTGAVTSPEPYVEASITVGILRTQSLATLWREQWEATGVIGSVDVHSDTAAFSKITLDNCVIQHFDPNAFDGEDPVSRLMLRGIYYINVDLWNQT